MAVGAKSTSASPSLQRLLSLDKSFDSLEERIQEAARILRLPNNTSVETALAGDKTRRAQHDAAHAAAHTARHEFVLRWLLDKLKTQPSVRRNPLAWSLLYSTLDALPSAVVSKALSGTGLLPLVSQAFSDIFHAGPGAVASVEPIPAAHVPDDKASKKRKRNNADMETAVGSELSTVPLDEVDGRHIFCSVAAILRLLLDHADGPDTCVHAPVHNQIRSVLTLDNKSFAILMKHWLTALSLFVPTEQSPTPAHTVILVEGLKVISNLLSFQPTLQSSDSGASFDQIFCIESLTPAALLLSSLHQPSSLSLSPGVAVSIQELERLLAQQLFVPARTTFHTAGENRAASTKPSSVRIQMGLVDRLESFRADIVHLADESGREPDTDAKLVAAQKSLPYLLDVALRCTPTASPRQRIAETSWIDALFTALCDALPRSASFLDDDQTSTANIVLADMLDVLLSRKLSLTSNLLVKLVNDWSDLLRWGNEALPNAGQPDFVLLSKALAMDSAIFTDSKSARPRALFQALTIHGQVIGNDHDKILSTHELLCKFIAIPLMKAYARTRNLAGFIDQWLQQLQKDSSWQSQTWSIWTDQHLQASLRDVLEASLTIAQIADIIELCRLSLVELTIQRADAKKVAPAISSHASASAVILNAVVGALRTDSAVDALREQIELIAGTAQDLVKKANTNDTVLRTILLTLLSRTSLLWLPVWSSTSSREEVEERLQALIKSPAVEQSLVVMEALRHQPGSTTTSTLALQQKAAAAAFTFIATTCDILKRSRAQNGAMKELLARAVLPFTAQDTSSAEAAPRPITLYTTMTNYPSLLDYIPSDVRKGIFKEMLRPPIERCTSGQATVRAFADAVLSTSCHAVQDELFVAATACLDSNAGSSAERSVAENLLLQWSSKGLSRPQREAVLNLVVDAILQPGDDTPELRPRLGLMVNLLGLPSATAAIAIDSSIVWQLASALSEEEQGSLTLDLFEETCSLVFAQIVDNKDQKRSATFLTNISESVAILMEAKLPFRSCTGQLRLLSAFVQATEGRLDEVSLSELPHRSSSAIDCLVKRLYNTLSNSLEEDQDTASASIHDNMSISVRLYNSLPASFLASGGSPTSKYTKRFTKLLDTLLGLSGLKTVTVPHSDDSIPLSVQVQSYQRLAPASIQDNASRFCGTAENLLLHGLDAKQHHTVLHTFAESLSLISDTDKLALIGHLLTPSGGSLRVTAEKVGLVRCTIMSLQSPKTPDEAFSVGVLTQLLSLLRECGEFDTHCELIDCVVALLRNKPTLVTQYGVEMTVATLIHITTPSSPRLESKKAHAIFEGLCDMTRSLLQFHRPSLGGRYHVFIPLLERLVACLFTPASRDNAATGRFKHPTWIDNKQHPLTISHAQRVSRLLENLCNPPQSDVSKRRQRPTAGHDLVDMTRKSRIQVGQHVQHILHYLCTLLLNGRLGEGMRDALTPGLWAVIDVTEMGADESRGVKALSASMNNAERAILRTVFEDWRRFGSWSG